MSRFVVRTRDVDGSTSRKFATMAGARKRFESMLGMTVEQAIAEQYGDEVKPLVVLFVRGVSMFGTVVSLEVRS